ncbi:unnamed protein product [Lampetra fluviatilis]
MAAQRGEKTCHGEIGRSVSTAPASGPPERAESSTGCSLRAVGTLWVYPVQGGPSGCAWPPEEREPHRTAVAGVARPALDARTTSGWPVLPWPRQDSGNLGTAHSPSL